MYRGRSGMWAWLLHRVTGLLLTLALLHGMNGLRVVIDDYVPTRAWRIRIQSLLGTLVVILFMVGTVTLITFEPVAGSLGPACLK